jgi:purine-binding chemotaxis protein CheW
MPDAPPGPGRKVLEQIHRAQQNHLAEEVKDSFQQQYLSFRLNQEWYGLVVYHLVEVLPLPRITRVPSVPEHILGVMNFRGEVLSVIDLKRFFGVGLSAPDEEAAIIVVEHDEVRTSLLVDAIGDLINLAPEDLTEAPLLVGKAQGAFFDGALRWEEVLLTIINLERLLQAEGLYFSEG